MKEYNEIENRQLRIRLPDNLWAQVEVYARATNRSINSVIRTAVEEYIAENTKNETVFLETMNKLTAGFKQLVEQEKYTKELVESLHSNLDSMNKNLTEIEYESRTLIVLFLDFLRHSYSMFRKELDSRNRTSADSDASFRFLNDYIQEFIAFRNNYGTGFVRKALEVEKINNTRDGKISI